MDQFNEQFQWKCQPEAEKLLLEMLEACKQANPAIHELEESLQKMTNTRLFDWVDHFLAGDTIELLERLEATGFECEEKTESYQIFFHPGAQLPRVVVYPIAPPVLVLGVAVCVESIANYLQVRGLHRTIEGSMCSHFRRCCVATEHHVSLWVVERRGSRTIEPTVTTSQAIQQYLFSQELWKTVPRSHEDEEEAFAQAFQAADEIIRLLGTDLAAWVVLECERDYWQSKNTAGQIQKNRQDRLGMGWANHDHHTFRSSRKHFVRLVQFFEKLGFHCRERFYAGAEAGWGAQVMENPRARLVLFLDVDLSPEEIGIDFAHEELPERDRLGTIGLWCALHGDSLLHAGMHHLEAQFLFDELKEDLAASGVGMMAPFSSFPYLKQAFTTGEVWPVSTKRIEKLHRQGKITDEQAEKFLANGAIGSHLENLQRREGYKGFNQKNVSFIIKETDPRTIRAGGA